MKSLLIIFLSCVSIFAQGIPYNTEFQVNTYTESDQYYPSVSCLKSNGFVICWSSRGQASDYRDIYGQLFDSRGFKLGKEFKVNTISKYDQSNSSVCSLSDSGFVIWWASQGQDGSGWGVFAQILITMAPNEALNSRSIQRIIINNKQYCEVEVLSSVVSLIW